MAESKMWVPEGAVVRVKALEWSDRGYDWSWWATNTTLDYRIRRYAPNEFWVDVDGETIEADAPQPSFDAAAALANLHHEARIMAALEPMPQREVNAEAFMDAVWAALKADANDLRKQQRILRAFLAALEPMEPKDE